MEHGLTIETAPTKMQSATGSSVPSAIAQYGVLDLCSFGSLIRHIIGKALNDAYSEPDHDIPSNGSSHITIASSSEPRDVKPAPIMDARDPGLRKRLSVGHSTKPRTSAQRFKQATARLPQPYGT
jgi:hypothetical protein